MGSCQLCLACFLYFCKSLSIIPKWPNRCHVELVKAQSHDSKQERRPGHGNQPARSCLGPKSPRGREQLSARSVLPGLRTGLPASPNRFKIESVFNAAQIRAGELPFRHEGRDTRLVGGLCRCQPAALSAGSWVGTVTSVPSPAKGKSAPQPL